MGGFRPTGWRVEDSLDLMGCRPINGVTEQGVNVAILRIFVGGKNRRSFQLRMRGMNLIPSRHESAWTGVD